MKPAIFTIMAGLLLPSAFAEEQPDTRLREALKNTILQLRTAQGETAKAQADSIAATQKTTTLEVKVAELEKRNEKLAKQANDDKTASEKSIATLNNRIAEREQRLAEYIAALDKWKAGYQMAADTARAKDSERARLADEALTLKRTLADRERKNLNLFNISIEILDRYANYALGKSLAAKEPFIGNARVRVENQVQGYKDKIIEQRLNAPTPRP